MNVNAQRRVLILCKVYCDALTHANLADNPAEIELDLQDEAGENLDDLRAYMSDDGEHLVSPPSTRVADHGIDQEGEMDHTRQTIAE
jgi:hypothetical protein